MNSLIVTLLLSLQNTTQFPPPKSLGPIEDYGKNIQRTMRLLAQSTPEKPNRVKILFYGQSITEQKWWKQVADDLRRRFPHADLVIENRAIGGFSSQLLVKTAETDLYSFYPDLLIFHVYGSHLEYENIIRRVRQRTTAEILIQTDHITKPEDLTEEMNPQKLTTKQWSSWMNHAFLPGTAQKYDTELCNQHELWKLYLQDHQLQPKQLLSDDVHLNDHGCYLMAEIVKAYLRHDLNITEVPAANWVKTYTLGQDAHWKEGRLDLDFTGNRIDVILDPSLSESTKVLLDNKAPDQHPGVYVNSRTSPYPGTNWPCLLEVGADQPPVKESWKLTLTELADDYKTFKFKVAGSVTGEDGIGESGKKFISRSGRVVIDPADWNFDYARKVFGPRLKPNFEITWTTFPQALNSFSAPEKSQNNRSQVLTLAQGLSNTSHHLTLQGSQQSPIKAVRVYTPPLKQP